MNCSGEVNGVRYLIADLSVACYEGAHLVYIAAAALGVVVYCIGVPLLVYGAVAWKTCVTFRTTVISEGEEGEAMMTREWTRMPQLRCRRRATRDYLSRSVRLRFGFLFNGASHHFRAVLTCSEMSLFRTV